MLTRAFAHAVVSRESRPRGQNRSGALLTRVGSQAILPTLRRYMINEPEPLAGIAPAQRRPPPFIVEIPAHRRFDALLEGDLRLPAKFVAQSRRIDGIA